MFTQRLKLDPSLIPCTQINSKWIKDLSIKSETLRLLEERVQKTLQDAG